MPKVPKKAVLEEPIPVAVPKKPEPAPARGTCYPAHRPKQDCFLLSEMLLLKSDILSIYDYLKFPSSVCELGIQSI